MTVEAPRLTGTTRYVEWHQRSEDGSMVKSPIHGRVTRYIATPYTGQSGPYKPIPVTMFAPLSCHSTVQHTVRTIESFLAKGEVLHGDGVTDDTVVMNACLSRAVRMAEKLNSELVVSLTRIYLCDDTLMLAMWRAAPNSPGKVVPIVPMVGLQITGPGRTVRTYNDWSRRMTAGLPVESCWQAVLARRLKFQAFGITGFRQNGARTKNKEVEGERGIFLISCQDVEVTEMDITNTMGDHVSFGSNPYAVDAATKRNKNVRLYGGHWKNSGRLMLEPLCSDLDVYGILWEICAASVMDIEVTGNPWQPQDPENGLHRIRVSHVIHHDRDGNHGTFMHIPAIGSGPAGSLGNSPNTYDLEVAYCVRYGGPIGFVAGGDSAHNTAEHDDWTMAGFSWHGHVWSGSASGLGSGVDLSYCRGAEVYDNHGPLTHGSGFSTPSVGTQIKLNNVWKDGDRNTPGTKLFTDADYIRANPGVFVNPRQYDQPVDKS